MKVIDKCEEYTQETKPIVVEDLPTGAVFVHEDHKSRVYMRTNQGAVILRPGDTPGIVGGVVPFTVIKRNPVSKVYENAVLVLEPSK